MKKNTKSSVTLPPNELKLVDSLVRSLGAKSKVEIIRRGLHLLKSQTDRQSLKEAYQRASIQVRSSMQKELDDLDALSDEGIV